MDGGARQQAYDRGHTIFSPDGRLYQVGYAREAVERGSPAVAVRTDEGIVLAARKRLRSPLLEPDSVAKIHRIDDHLAIASAGHAADARRLVDEARVASQRHRLRYDEPMPADALTTALADAVQERTQTGGARPYGAALLVAGAGDSAIRAEEPSTNGDHERFRLFEVDPSGTPYGWRGTAIGDGSAALRGYIEAELTEGVSAGATIDGGVKLALGALRLDEETEPEPAAFECVSVGAGPTIDRRSTDEIASALDAAAS